MTEPAEAPPAETPEAPAAPEQTTENPFAGVFRDEEAPAEPTIAEEAEAANEIDADGVEAEEAPDPKAPAEEADEDGGSATAEAASDGSEPSESGAPGSTPGEGEGPPKEYNVPSWHAKMAERRGKQAERIETAAQQQIAQMRAVHDAQLQAMAAEMRALKAEMATAKAPPTQQGPAIPFTGDLAKDWESFSRAYGKDGASNFSDLTDFMANEGQPGPAQAMAAARQAQEEAAKIKADFEQQLKDRDEQIKKAQHQANIRAWTDEGVAEVNKLLEHYRVDPDAPPDVQEQQFWWMDHLSPAYVQQRARYWAEHAVLNPPKEGGAWTAQDVAATLDNELRALFAKGMPPRQGASRDKGPRRLAGKPAAPNGKRPKKKAPTITNKDAASLSPAEIEKLTDAERAEMATREFAKAIGAEG